MPDGRVERAILFGGVAVIVALVALLIQGATDYAQISGATEVPADVGESPSGPQVGLRLRAAGEDVDLLVRPDSESGTTLLDGVLGQGESRLFPSTKLWIRVRRGESNLIAELSSTIDSDAPPDAESSGGSEGSGESPEGSDGTSTGLTVTPPVDQGP